MYNAKAAGKARLVVFQPHMQEQLHDRLRLEQDIDLGLARDEFFLEFQPVVDLTSRELLGVEALLRWNHPQRGIDVDSVENLPSVAQDSERMLPLDVDVAPVRRVHFGLDKAFHERQEPGRMLFEKGAFRALDEIAHHGRVPLPDLVGGCGFARVSAFSLASRSRACWMVSQPSPRSGPPGPKRYLRNKHIPAKMTATKAYLATVGQTPPSRP